MVHAAVPEYFADSAMVSPNGAFLGTGGGDGMDAVGAAGGRSQGRCRCRCRGRRSAAGEGADGSKPVSAMARTGAGESCSRARVMTTERRARCWLGSEAREGWCWCAGRLPARPPPLEMPCSRLASGARGAMDGARRDVCRPTLPEVGEPVRQQSERAEQQQAKCTRRLSCHRSATCSGGRHRHESLLHTTSVRYPYDSPMIITW